MWACSGWTQGLVLPPSLQLKGFWPEPTSSQDQGHVAINTRVKLFSLYQDYQEKDLHFGK